MKLELITPELILTVVSGILMLVGVSSKVIARRSAPLLALGALLIVFVMQLSAMGDVVTASSPSIISNSLSTYVKLIASGVGILLVLLAWPTNASANGSRSMDLGSDVGEFFS